MSFKCQIYRATFHVEFICSQRLTDELLTEQLWHPLNHFLLRSDQNSGGRGRGPEDLSRDHRRGVVQLTRLPAVRQGAHGGVRRGGPDHPQEGRQGHRRHRHGQAADGEVQTTSGAVSLIHVFSKC